MGDVVTTTTCEVSKKCSSVQQKPKLPSLGDLSIFQVGQKLGPWKEGREVGGDEGWGYVIKLLLCFRFWIFVVVAVLRATLASLEGSFEQL